MTAIDAEMALIEPPTVSFNGCQIESYLNSTNPETVVQLKFYNSPITIWKRRYKERCLWFRVSPIDLGRRDSETALLHHENQESSNILDFVEKCSTVKIAVLNEAKCKFTSQEQFGHKYDPTEYVVFDATTNDPEKMAFMIDFYVDDKDNATVPEHAGFCYILPSNLRGTCGVCTMPVTGKKHHPIGQLSVEYLTIKAMQGYKACCELDLTRHWQPMAGGMDVGHRGAGSARRTEKVENVLENTVASFNYAASHGADMVELDVQLSKDMVAVIYHDHFINISMKKKKSAQDEYLQIPIKDLTLHQLQMLKLSPVNKPNKLHYDFLEDDEQDNQPFPTLERVLEAVDSRCGFNVEIKYPMQRKDGSWDGNLERVCDLNEYIDIILDTVLRKAGNRSIILSCFHPDICTMIRLKQKKYPLLFLTQGRTQKWASYWDPRTESVQMAVYFAISNDLLGINAHAEDLLKDRSLISFVKSKRLVLFTWGDDLNETNVIKHMKRDGVDGVCYDKIDEYCSKNDPQLFVADDRKTLYEMVSGTNEVSSSWGSSGISTNSASP